MLMNTLLQVIYFVILKKCDKMLKRKGLCLLEEIKRRNYLLGGKKKKKGMGRKNVKNLNLKRFSQCTTHGKVLYFGIFVVSYRFWSLWKENILGTFQWRTFQVLAYEYRKCDYKVIKLIY